jgi:GR25 family glycosyltransferase involved in LPS biosynthesis
VLKDYGKNKLVKHYHDTFGTTAYLLKPEGAKVLLQKSSHFHAHVDDFFGHDWIHGLKILSVLPYPIKPSGAASTISCSDKQAEKLSRIEKWLIKIRKLPRSIRKRLYRMRTFTELYFKRIK